MESSVEWFDKLMEAKAEIEADPDKRLKVFIEHLKGALQSMQTATEERKAGHPMAADTYQRYALASLYEAQKLAEPKESPGG